MSWWLTVISAAGATSRAAGRVDVVVRKHQLRHTDFREGKRLGKDDHLVCWSKPQRPKWMRRKTYAALPHELTLREVRVRVAKKRFAPKNSSW